MGLDVYVGTLSRYYTGQWETIVQQYGREAGMAVRVVRPSDARLGFFARIFDRLRPTPNVHRQVARWQEKLSQLAGTTITWDDSENREYFTDKPAWDCYGALLLWAAYEEHGATNFPDTAERWHEDPVYEIAARDGASKYIQLLSGAEIWVPADFARPFDAPTLAGNVAVVGSVPRLHDQLKALNAATWGADADTLETWRQEGSEFGASLLKSAQFGFAVLAGLVELAVQHRLPVKLDY